MPAWTLFIRTNRGKFLRSLAEATQAFGRTVPPERVSRTVVRVGLIWSCDLCMSVFASKQALSVHRARKHWQTCEARKYIDGTCCRVCGLECHTRHHIIDHISCKSPICLLNYRLRGEQVPPDVIEGLDAAEFARVKACKGNSRRQPRAAFRPALPSRPVLRPDDVWVLGTTLIPLDLIVGYYCMRLTPDEFAWTFLGADVDVA